MKSGFTLVELSIVLVIIGLLIGGILVGQSLIESTKINQAVRQIQQYDIATSNFQNKFRELPGDTRLFSPAGNNNGTPDDNTGETSCGLASCKESYSFWKHLSDSSMLEQEYSNVYTAEDTPDEINSPEFLDTNLGTGYVATSFGFYGAQGWVYYTPSNIDGVTVYALDSKLDDGNISSGYGRSFVGLSGCLISSTACSFNINVLSTQGRKLD